MNAIAGEINFFKPTAISENISKMLHRMQLNSRDRADIRLKKCVAFGFLCFNGKARSLPSPHSDADQNFLVAMQGKISNRFELWKQLNLKIALEKISDEEIIVECYKRWGEDFPQFLKGFFAIALFDSALEKSYLVRDQMGICPIYYTKTKTGVLFASTLQAVLATNQVDTNINPVALHHYLSWHSIVPDENTILQGVKKVPAATMVSFNSFGEVSERKFWDLSYVRDPIKDGWQESEWVAAFEHQLLQAISDATPETNGVLLSGGLDSSLIVALLNEIDQKKITTFSIGFESSHRFEGDEFYFSDLVSKKYQTTHNKLIISNSELLEAVPNAIAAMSEPMSSHDAVAFYLLAKFVSSYNEDLHRSKTVFAGQGADEVFAGYKYHQDPKSFKKVFFDYTHSDLKSALKEDLFLDSNVSDMYINKKISSADAASDLDSLLWLDTHSFMVDDPVKRVDNMLRAHNMSARLPFLSQSVVELAAKCPPDLKLNHDGKGVLKQLGRKFLSEEIIFRQKGYFPVPIFKEFNQETLNLARDTLLSQSARSRNIFKEEYIAHLLSNPNESVQKTGRNALWTITVLELWLQSLNI